MGVGYCVMNTGDGEVLEVVMEMILASLVIDGRPGRG